MKTALTSMSKGACKAENDALPLKVETVPQASLDQKLQLLARTRCRCSSPPAMLPPSPSG
ncbi:hypothetical protein SALBM135S_03694 [Streptomyces alboniger]